MRETRLKSSSAKDATALSAWSSFASKSEITFVGVAAAAARTSLLAGADLTVFDFAAGFFAGFGLFAMLPSLEVPRPSYMCRFAGTL
jgi:hypothetical protein